MQTYERNAVFAHSKMSAWQRYAIFAVMTFLSCSLIAAETPSAGIHLHGGPAQGQYLMRLCEDAAWGKGTIHATKCSAYAEAVVDVLAHHFVGCAKFDPWPGVVMPWGAMLFNYLADHRDNAKLMDAAAAVAMREVLISHFGCLDHLANEIRKETRYLEYKR